MISVVLYGRNDSYGYNLHKRAALSLNCMAEVLTAPGDEILFVDYNTPDDYPTFPEAIADTLTDKCKGVLRTLRVRPKAHTRRFADRTHLKALEPVSRNVAIRRSNPDNRWVLSTNTDMIFVPRDADGGPAPSLTEAVGDLPDGFYCTPRFEIPETLWEAFDRRDPAGVIARTAELGSALHLNEVVRGAENIRYDAPGDFQLVRREDLFAIHGFQEDMLLGWHLDSNLSRRLRFLHTEVGDALPHVFGYHCDHTRQVTPMHAPSSVENSLADFVDGVTHAEIPGQADTWGLAGEDVEEVALNRPRSAAFESALRAVTPAPLAEPTEAAYVAETYDDHATTAEHVLPFLLDLFVNAPAGHTVGWVSGEAPSPLSGAFATAFAQLGGGGTVVDLRGTDGFAARQAEADTLVLDFGVPRPVTGVARDALAAAAAQVVAAERDRLRAGLPRRRVVGLNAVHNPFETFMTSWFGCARTPFSARLRHGYLRADAVAARRDVTDQMRPGGAGVREDGALRATGRRGHVFFGPYASLPPGGYVAEITCAAGGGPRLRRRVESVTVDVVDGDHELAAVRLRLPGRGQGPLRVPFTVPPGRAFPRIEVRLHAAGGCRARFERVELAEAGV